MINQTLNEIKDFAVRKLQEEYDFCGLADGEDMAMLNSTDKEGNDIIINIKVKKD
jgi:hypothetical protein